MGSLQVAGAAVAALWPFEDTVLRPEPIALLLVGVILEQPTAYATLGVAMLVLAGEHSPVAPSPRVSRKLECGCLAVKVLVAFGGNLVAADALRN